MKNSFSNDFLLDEVRCGFFIPAEIKQAWAAQLEVLQAVDKVCRDNKITYFADWGTLLGAIRHRGFIPWDDDLDIVMKREDYEHFRRVENQLPEGFSIHTFRNEEGFREFHATVVGAPSVSFEKEHLRKFHGFPYLCGLDIFILDYVYADEKREEERVHNIKYVIAVADAILDGGMNEQAIEIGLEKIRDITGEKIDRTQSKKEQWIRLYELAEKLCGEVPEAEARELTQMIPWGIIGKRFRFDKRFYEKTIRVPFEYTTMPVPLLYDEMLTKRYGNYMHFAKAAGGHEYPFYMGQKERLQELLDFDLPGYRFSENELSFREKNQTKVQECESWREIIIEAVDNFKSLSGAIVESSGNYALQENADDYMQSIADCQQLLIDIGNYIEQIKGEGCSVIADIESGCEVLFRMYESDVNSGDNSGINQIVEAAKELDAVSKLICREISELTARREILFLITHASEWKYLKDIAAKECSDGNTDCIVLAQTYYFKDYDGTPTEYVNESDKLAELFNEDEGSAAGSNYIRPVPEEGYDLELHRPDRIYFQNPFDNYNPVYSVHPVYYSDKLIASSAEVVFVHSLEVDSFKRGDRAWRNMGLFITMPGVLRADRIFVADNELAGCYLERLSDFAGEGSRDYWSGRIIGADTNTCEADANTCEAYEGKNAGCEDKNADYKEKTVNKSQLLYCIGIGQLMSRGEAYITKFRRNLEIFKENAAGISVTVISERILEAELAPDTIKMLRSEFEAAGVGKWITADEALDISRYTAYYGDACYLVPEFVMAHKPVMIQNIDIDN